MFLFSCIRKVSYIQLALAVQMTESFYKILVQHFYKILFIFMRRKEMLALSWATLIKTNRTLFNFPLVSSNHEKKRKTHVIVFCESLCCVPSMLFTEKYTSAGC